MSRLTQSLNREQFVEKLIDFYNSKSFKSRYGKNIIETKSLNMEKLEETIEKVSDEYLIYLKDITSKVETDCEMTRSMSESTNFDEHLNDVMEDFVEFTKNLPKNLSYSEAIFTADITENDQNYLISFTINFLEGDCTGPFYYIMYFDDKNKLRAFVPSVGNTYDLDEKAPFYIDDFEDKLQLPNYNIMIESFLKRISLKK